MKKGLFFLVILVSLLAIAIALSLKSRVFKEFLGEKDVHYHAGFLVYKDDALLDFSDIKYMHIKPCAADEEKNHEKEEGAESPVHLHDNIGDVAHIHGPGITWGMLLQYLKLDMSTSYEVYINKEKVGSALDKVIQPYDSALFLLGKNIDINGKLQKSVTKEHIIKVEGQGESC